MTIQKTTTQALQQMMCLGALCVMTAACGDSNDGAYYGNQGSVGAPNVSGEQYDQVVENDYVEAGQEDTSTFSIDVDTASYTLMRRDINSGRLPATDSVRPEEYINYFDYAYIEPQGEDPFSINLEVAPSHFGEGKHLMRVGLRGKALTVEDLKPTNLVFLIDVSGSMQSEEKLPLVKKSLYTLLDNLRPSDTVGIVVYAGDDRVALEPTEVRNRAAIERAVNTLGAGGGTNGQAGIEGAYKLAERARKEGGNNRVIILTDGDFNIGKRGDDLFTLIEEYRAKEISLTCMGYGLGNFNDYNMENLSNRGNGNYFYVDTLAEAVRVFGTELASTIEVIAADVKIQVEFNSDAVKRYRLLGYENRLLENEDFEDDAKDAGEIGPGHTVTAYYELELNEAAEEQAVLSDVRVRYKSQYGEESQLIERAIKITQIQDNFEASSEDFRFGAAVAEYAEVLRQSKHVEQADLPEIKRVAEQACQESVDAKKDEFMELVSKADSMMTP